MDQVRVCAEIGVECMDSNLARRPATGRIVWIPDGMESRCRRIETNLSSSVTTHVSLLMAHVTCHKPTRHAPH